MKRLFLVYLAYTTLILVWFSLWFFTGEYFWWMMVLNRFVPYFFLPLPFIILIAALKKSPGFALLCLPSVLIFSWLYRPYVLPKFSIVSESPDFRVMTFNVLFDNRDDEAIANIILRQQPDLVALQEVQPAMMAALSSRLNRVYPYALLGYDHDYGTTAVISRHPFLNQTILDLEADRPATIVTVLVKDQPITFSTVHLLAYGLQWVPLSEIPDAINQRTQNQNRQAQILLKALEDYDNPVIIACDCNSKETSSSYQILIRSMKNAAREVGWQIKARGTGERSDTKLQHIQYLRQITKD